MRPPVGPDRSGEVCSIDRRDFCMVHPSRPEGMKRRRKKKRIQQSVGD